MASPPRSLGSLGTAMLTVAICLLCNTGTPFAQALPEGYWDASQSQTLLDRTMVIRLAPDLSGLSTAERQALQKLIEVGNIFHGLYEKSRHHQAQQAHAKLVKLDAQTGTATPTQNLLKLYRMFRGPIATTLENKREPFLPVDETVPGKNVYPWGVTKAKVEEFLQSHPERRASLLHVRTRVRGTDESALRLDLGTLKRHPVLEALHPGLRERLRDLVGAGSPSGYYAVPYAVAYADDMVRAHGLLSEAAALIEATDAAFARYLRHRARDLLSNDYEAGDAAWVTGRFGKLNALIGAYETYDDELYATKAFYAVSLLLRDEQQSEALRSAIQGMQEFEDSLPYTSQKRVREDIPVGVYNVIADFGQARGTNTATILPNEAYIARQYGRTILMRYNILTNTELFANTKAAWDAVVEPRAHADFKIEGNFYRTLWHEIGHYLGPDLTQNGGTVDDALEENSSTFEEMKADLVSLFLAKRLHSTGYYSDERLRGVYASGIRRVLRNNRPRREQAYATMQLMQLNYFLENRLLEFDTASQKLRIDYARYHDVVGALLEKILALQYDGDKAATDAFIERYTTWKPDLHEVLAKQMRESQRYRYRLVYYAALDE